MAKTEEKITQMYDAQLKSQKAQLQKDNDAANASLDKAQLQNQKTTDANLNRVAVEAQKDMMNDAEYYASSGLSSGARAQARQSRANQLSADMTALRKAGLEADAEAERQRALLAKEYAAAITQAQAENDLKKAQALYEQAQLEEQRLLQKQLAEEETRQVQIKAQGDLAAQQAKLQLEGAKYLADETGDYSAIAKLYGYSDEQKYQLGIESGYYRNYEVGADGRPSGVLGHGLLTNTGNKAEVKVTTNAGKTGITSVPVMQAQDGSLWYWDHMQRKYVPFALR